MESLIQKRKNFLSMTTRQSSGLASIKAQAEQAAKAYQKIENECEAIIKFEEEVLEQQRQYNLQISEQAQIIKDYEEKIASKQKIIDEAMTKIDKVLSIKIVEASKPDVKSLSQLAGMPTQAPLLGIKPLQTKPFPLAQMDLSEAATPPSSPVNQGDPLEAMKRRCAESDALLQQTQEALKTLLHEESSDSSLVDFVEKCEVPTTTEVQAEKKVREQLMRKSFMNLKNYAALFFYLDEKLSNIKDLPNLPIDKQEQLVQQCTRFLVAKGIVDITDICTTIDGFVNSAMYKQLNAMTLKEQSGKESFVKILKDLELKGYSNCTSAQREFIAIVVCYIHYQKQSP